MRANEWRLLGWAIYSASVPVQMLVNVACGGPGDPWWGLVVRGFFVCLPLYLALELCLSRARRAAGEAEA